MVLAPAISAVMEPRPRPPRLKSAVPCATADAQMPPADDLYSHITGHKGVIWRHMTSIVSDAMM